MMCTLIMKVNPICKNILFLKFLVRNMSVENIFSVITVL